MLDGAAPILKTLYRDFPKGGADLETISRIVTGVTFLDRTHYVGFEAQRTNPIWGTFRRFDQHDAVYAGEKTIVEVRYAQHLDEDELVFVVSKELFHSLEAAVGQHVVSDAAIEALVKDFSNLSKKAATELKTTVTEFHLELLVTILAAEVVCPITYRRSVMTEAGDDPDWEALGSVIKIPYPYRRALCSLSQMNSTEQMLKSMGAL
jgi:hypothetical protein